MSVLIKALEKAAQDRDKVPSAHVPAVAAERELSLEALDATSSATAAGNVSSAAAGNKPGSGSAGHSSSLSKTAANVDKARSNAQIHAATVLGAQQSSSAGAIEWVRAHPLYFSGGSAGLFLLAYAAYVYVQIAHPGLLIKSPPPPPSVAVAPAPASVDSTPAAGGTSAPSAAPVQTPATANSQLIPLQSVFASRVDAQSAQPAPEMAKDVSGRVPATLAAPAASAPRSGIVAAISPSAPLMLPQSRIAISRGDTAAPRLNATVSEAYAALESGQFDTAQRLYSQVVRSEPANVDALLGLASIAQKENRSEDVQRHFLAILDVEPRNALAQSGLVALMSRADPQAAESRLKQLLAREPSPPLYFNLGNLYADQGLWPQAQQAYFQAHNLEPRNPDYAYNLAVGLEHLGQQKLALGFYRKALQLVSAKGATNFDSARIQDRITQLSARFE
ncbi:MAG TPA: tetratricopeptide repeat protein [Burkholderiales bacterium]|nr:tetratricopeptide repeat protein [Burkholderiales bacterium]